MGLEGYGSPGPWTVKEQLLLFDGGVAPLSPGFGLLFQAAMAFGYLSDKHYSYPGEKQATWGLCQ